MQYGIIPVLFILLAGSSVLVNIPNSYGQEDIQIPSWIKNVAGWWGNDEISEREFLAGIEWLINNNIILLEHVPCSITTSTSGSVPDWVKNNAKWWAEDLIEETDFINGIEYLIKKQVVGIDNSKILGEASLADVTFSDFWTVDKNYLAFVQSSFFEIYGTHGDCIIQNGTPAWQSLVLGLHPDKGAMYNEVSVWDDDYKTAVVYPMFTAFAYADQGFYDYYGGQCDRCTTVKFSQPSPIYTSSGMGHQALTLLGYYSLTDIEIDQNPEVLEQFDKVIMLHNEYVTQAMFDAITSHPNVIYLYPNALYAEIEVDYMDETITLIRGHNYPEHEIKNGFDWEFDNTHPYEYDNNCSNMEFYKTEDGWMTTCYPENVFLQNSELLFSLLKTIKDL